MLEPFNKSLIKAKMRKSQKTILFGGKTPHGKILGSINEIKNLKMNARKEQLITKRTIPLWIRGFTLIELLIAIVIVGTMASIAIPQLQTLIEKFRAQEGKNILLVLLGAQLKYRPDNNNNFANNLTDLDVVIGQPKNFATPIAVAQGFTSECPPYGATSFNVNSDLNRFVANMRSNDGKYTLYACLSGPISCAPTAAFRLDKTCWKIGMYRP